MPAQFTPVRLDPSQLDEAAAMLARAFMQDPPLAYCIPDAIERARLLPSLFRTNLRCAFAVGEIWTTPSAVSGIAMWLPPEHPLATDEDMTRAGIANVANDWGQENFGRLLEIGPIVEKAHREAITGPTWNLFFLGVAPEEQGKGIGHALVRHMYPRADAAAAMCYLDTFDPRNPPKYLRMGFRHFDEATVPGTTLRFWVMKRAPGN